MPHLATIGLIAAGGALGAVMRYGVTAAALRLFGSGFPVGTLIVNVLGSFAIGLVWGLAERMPLPHRLSPFLVTGALGAFTTFSTYSMETFQLLRNGEPGLALLNFGLSNGLAFLAVIVGFAAARLLPVQGG